MLVLISFRPSIPVYNRGTLSKWMCSGQTEDNPQESEEVNCQQEWRALLQEEKGQEGRMQRALNLGLHTCS